jgi:hypothetical protein
MYLVNQRMLLLDSDSENASYPVDFVDQKDLNYFETIVVVVVAVVVVAAVAKEDDNKKKKKRCFYLPVKDLCSKVVFEFLAYLNFVL